MKAPPKIITLYIIAVILFLSPFALRLAQDNFSPPGSEPYYHARLASTLLEEGMIENDSLAQDRLIFWNPFHLLLAAAIAVVGWAYALTVLPLAFGLASVGLLISFLKAEKTKPMTLYVTLFVFILSPVTIALSTRAVPASVSVFLILLGMLFLQRKSYWPATIVFSLNALMGVLPGIVSLVFMWSYSRIRKREIQLPFVITFLALLLFNIPRIIKSTMTVPSFISVSGLNSIISDVGSSFGLSTFAILLAIAGIPLIRKYKKQHYHLYLLVVLIFAGTFFFNPLLPYTNLIVSILAGITITSIIDLKWRLESIKYLTIFVILCGILFSSISHITLEVSEGPQKEFISGLKWIKDNSEPDDKVLIHYSQAYWVEFFAERPVLLDAYWEGSINAEEMNALSQEIFMGLDLTKTSILLNEQNIRYIVLTPDYWEGLIWEKPNKGFHFLIENSESFKKQFDGNNVEIWSYEGQVSE